MKYTVIGERPAINLTSPEIFSEKTISPELTTSEMIDLALSETGKRLTFSSRAESNDPIEVLKTGAANCVGYSAVFNSILQELISKHGKDESIHAVHLVARLELLSIDLHQFARSSFLRDHDFNKIEDLETGEIYYVDPSVSDILRITRVSAN
jgi:hypothetical protein